MPTASQFQPIQLENICAHQSKVADVSSHRRNAAARGRAGTARGGRPQIVGGRSRLPNLLPEGLNLGAVGVYENSRPDPKLPFQPGTPKHEQRMRPLAELADLWATCVGVETQSLASSVRAAEHNGTGICCAIVPDRSQHRVSPGVMTILAGPPKFFPDLLANVMRCSQLVGHGVFLSNPKPDGVDVVGRLKLTRPINAIFTIMPSGPAFDAVPERS